MNSSHFHKPRSGQPAKNREITTKELDEIKHAFQLFDRDNKGWVYPREVKIALRALDFPVRKAEVLTLLGQATGSDGVQQVEYDVFESVIAYKIRSRQPIDRYKRAFRLLDVGGKGSIDFKSLRSVVHQLPDCRIEDTELRDMITEFDHDKDGVINEDEFLAIMQAYDE